VDTDTSKQRVAVTGASGLLGRALFSRLIVDGFQVVAGIRREDAPFPEGTVKQVLDLFDINSIRRFVQIASADWVIHCAAITDVDRCEREPATAEAVNATATRQLMSAVGETACSVLYISTDYVFDGRSGPKCENDTPNPINVYGNTKLQGEKAVAEAGSRHAIVRSSSFLGVGGPDRPTFAESMVRHMQNSPPLLVATDQRSNITPVEYLAAAIIEIVAAGHSGIWHAAGAEILSRYDFALRLARLFGLSERVVEPVPYGALHRAAARPLDGGLQTVRRLTAQPIPLDEALVQWRSAYLSRSTAR